MTWRLSVSETRTSGLVAHIKEGRRHDLLEHLSETSRLASVFGEEFGSGGWAGLAGLWHDAGKASEEFQRYIRSVASTDNTTTKKAARVDHSTYASLKAVEKFGPPGRILAYIMAGHHAGLPDWQSGESGLSGLAQRLNTAAKGALSFDTRALSLLCEIFSQDLPSEKPQAGTDPSMWIRMLFSCLVDADFLDTEAFMEPQRSEKRTGYPELKELLPLFERFMEEKTAGADPTRVNRLRAQVLEQCIAMSETPPSVFTLTVPTGGGKTLSSMAFALNHAVRHKKRRIIYVIPYTSIIEQVADQFREIFEDAVLEHHSNIEVSDKAETTRSRLASENWDAPIIVTTSVQFFESLHAARPGRCRKLHNIVNSVVVLDEVQLLPPDFLMPVIQALKEIQKHYGVTLLLSTATQPALTSKRSMDFSFSGFDEMKEIVEDPENLHLELKRTRLHIPPDLSIETQWEDLAEELSGHPSVLCVVNSRADCRTLHGLMPEGTIHLSALMCGAHRSYVISRIKERLNKGIPTRVISTQLVEAGVDLDFPVVYRALAGLDSIAQAAGRCNREGLLEEGLVRVFVPPTTAPPGILRQAAEAGRRLLSSGKEDPLAPKSFKNYFGELYWIRGDRLDREGILEDLAPGPALTINFRTAAQKFRIIDESRYRPVLVRFGKGHGLIEELKKNGPERWLMRRLQRYVVNVPTHIIEQLVAEGEVEEIYEGIYVQSQLGHYDEILGLCYGTGLREPDDLII